jgi:alkylation response protein AidB-like acyl-CoA dehydrogenase
VVNFGFTEEQNRLRNEFRRFLDERSPMAEVRRIAETGPGYSHDLWQEMGRLGWLGLTVPEAYGGSGLAWIDLVILLEETGRSLLPSPLIGHILATNAILEAGSEKQKKRWLPDLALGRRIGSVALVEEDDVHSSAAIRLEGRPTDGGWLLSGKKCSVADPEAADLFVVAFRSGQAPEEVGLAVIDADAPGVDPRAYAMIDATKRMGLLNLSEVRVVPDAVLSETRSPANAIDRLLDAGALAVAAEMGGSVDEALRITVEYAKQRIQFDRPIGQYQGVKHPLAEMYVDAESFKSLVYYSAWCFDNRGEELSRYVSLAKAYATEAFVRTGVDSVQIHGAVGFTTAQDIQLYFKRSKWARPMFGDAEAHYERVVAERGF